MISAATTRNTWTMAIRMDGRLQLYTTSTKIGGGAMVVHCDCTCAIIADEYVEMTKKMKTVNIRETIKLGMRILPKYIAMWSL
jgi:hypothetical protein